MGLTQPPPTLLRSSGGQAEACSLKPEAWVRAKPVKNW